MTNVELDFKGRVKEIESFFDFIQSLDLKDIELFDQNGYLAYPSHERENLLRTFKASAFLMLYNLMESTVSNAVEAIFDELANRGTTFDACCQKVRLIVLNNLKQHSAQKILPDLNQIANDIITKTFKKNILFSGNVDAQAIRGLANDYGFSSPAADGRDLLTVKSNRNDLAHGTKSFSEVGRSFSMPDIVRLKTQVIYYLGEMLSCVGSYISQQGYLSAPESS